MTEKGKEGAGQEFRDPFPEGKDLGPDFLGSGELLKVLDQGLPETMRGRAAQLHTLPISLQTQPRPCWLFGNSFL